MKELFQKLTMMPYEAHWFKTVPVNDVLNGVPSDCSDRTWVLADYCEKNEIEYGFIWSLFFDPLSLHVALTIEDKVFDTIWKVYDYPLEEYKQLIGAKYYCKSGAWPRRILR